MYQRITRRTTVAIARSEIAAPPRITRERYYALRDAGVLPERCELLNGRIVDKMSSNPPHAIVVTMLRIWLEQLYGAAFVREEKPIETVEDAPEPDIAVTTAAVRAYAHRHPGPADLLLVAEIADTTLKQDMSDKAGDYARAGIQLYWVVSISERTVWVHRSPVAGIYADVLPLGADELLTAPGREERIRVGELLP
jgi:Uma2 family endonuclease